jgi:hypothetical protein
MAQKNNRKDIPVFSGVFKYFPLALMEIAKCSLQGQKQHNPDKPLAWDREKSSDELDALSRHLLEAGTVDDDGILHDTKIAWRSLANLQKVLEEKERDEKWIVEQYNRNRLPEDWVKNYVELMNLMEALKKEDEVL